ncbi:MAG TPA: tRNA lysidine(34) synthetase TilS [Polyangia bacterium]|jgi:tRNA(Ile)-lysidine synthase|nr:tRNA lysidine(34) synthetase TilS [Polyangia bacterium]
MLSRVERTIREHGLLAPGDRVLCAVSGGPDSMALLHALWELRERWGLTLEAATIDHGLRPAARAEAALVAARAADLGLRWHLVAVDVRGARARARSRSNIGWDIGSSSSWQDVARQLRLAALERLAGEIGARRIALGHQADDQVETILFRILRGTGVRGLAGIPYRRDPFVRPLLDVERRQVLAYLRRRSIPFVEDPSNADPRFTRARLRHQVIPALRLENPRLPDALRALAADAARLAVAAGAPAASGDDLPPLNRRAARIVERLRDQRGGTRTVDVAGGQVEISYGQLRWHPRRDPVAGGPIAGAAARAAGPLTITAPGDYGWRGGPFVAVREAEGAPSSAVTGGALFDAELVGRPLRLRALRPGDRMRPRGGRGSRKLSDLLIDAKIARPLRARLPVLTTVDDQILFVPGLRPAELARPRAATRKWLQVFSAPSRSEAGPNSSETSV